MAQPIPVCLQTQLLYPTFVPITIIASVKQSTVCFQTWLISGYCIRFFCIGYNNWLSTVTLLSITLTCRAETPASIHIETCILPGLRFATIFHPHLFC